MAQLSRRRFIKGSSAATAGTATASLASPAIAQTMPEIRWRLAASWPKSIDVPFGSCETLAKYIAEATDNKFQVQLFAAGEIVPALQVLDAVQNSSVEMCHTATYYFIGKDPTWALFCAVPFSLNARQQNAWYYDGDGLKLMNEFGKKFNVYSLVAGNTGAQMGGWFRKEINTVDDLKGLKFRIGGWAGKTLQKLGVVPQQIAGGDIYPALEKGTIDAAESVGATAAGFANIEETARYDARNPAALKRLVAAGTQLRPFSPAIMEACLRASHEVNDETSATNPDYKKVW